MRTRIWVTVSFSLWLGLGGARSQMVDCVVAEVNGKAMTLTDVRIVREFAIIPEAVRKGVPARTLRQALEEAIDRRAVIDLVREDIDVSQEEADDFLALLKERVGAEQWQAKLTLFGLREEALRPYVEDLIRYIKTIELRFGPKAEVEEQEIERYYEDVYAPAERKSGREPKPLAQAQAEIEAWIKSEKSWELASGWVRSLRGQAEVRINEACLDQAK
jgi:GNAT superfamily N-acetyltransferase